ncbi:hypothetical protein [Ruegeria atlantica]|uniref:hypothetical protein n=1 Tax=Ruegeria atlantica TaxID=81569 RepID=UPI0020C40E20|nr:hypothetical protein [Ruegeria atlantica]
MTRKPARKRKNTDPETKLAEIDAEIARVRDREKKRLFQAAEKAGFFRYRFRTGQTLSLFRNAINGLDPRLRSTLVKLEEDAARLRSRIRKTERGDDARRKALLGGFLVAQCRHKPEIHAAIASDIRAFLADHPDPGVAARNLALLKDFLADPASTGEKDQTIAQSSHRDRAHRLILLGAWGLARHRTRADISLLITEELGRFLDQEKNADRHRHLLRDILP